MPAHNRRIDQYRQPVEQGALGASAESPRSEQGGSGAALPTRSPPDSEATFNHLRERANRGDRSAQEVLIKYLDAHPELWTRLAGLMDNTREIPQHACEGARDGMRRVNGSEVVG